MREEYTGEGKDKAAQARGRKGGKARAANMTAEQRSEVARKAAAKRWGERPADFLTTCKILEDLQIS